MAMAALPPEPPPLNMGSPRVRAALKVLGVHPKDLEPLDRSHLTGDSKEEAKFAYYERKRRQTIQIVASMSHKTSEAHHAKQEKAQIYGETDAFLAQVAAKEKAGIDKLKEQSKFAVQKMVLKEMETMEIHKAAQAKQEESRKRMKELRKLKDDQLKAAQKEGQKKQEKSKEVRERCVREKESHASELTAELKKQYDRAEAQTIKREEDWVQQRQEKKQELAQRTEDQAVRVASEMVGREYAYGKICDRYVEHGERMALKTNDLAEKAAEYSQRRDRYTENARRTLAKRQADREEAHHKGNATHKASFEARVDEGKLKLKEFSKNSVKARQVFEQRYERVVDEKMKHHLDRERLMDSRLSASLSRLEVLKGFSNPHHEFARPNALLTSDTNRIMKDMVHSNLEQLRRAKLYAQEQALQNIETGRQHLKEMEDAKERINERRRDMTKNTAIMNMHLTTQVDRARDAPPSKLHRIMVELGCPLPSAAKKEGEEEEQEKK